MWRSTLSRRDQGIHTLSAGEGPNRRAMHPRNEAELVNYIKGLTGRHLIPTRRMIKNFAAPILKKEPDDSWVTRFLNHNKDTLMSMWATPMDGTRHKANLSEKYRLCFELLHRKMAQYESEPEQTYNMDKTALLLE